MAVAGAPWDRGQEETGGGCGRHAGWRRHLQAGEQARRAGAPRGQQLRGGNLPENGRGLTEGRLGGRGWLGLCREELKEGRWGWGSGCALPARVGGERSWKQSRGLAVAGGPQSQGGGGGRREEAAVFSRGGRGFRAAEHQPGGRVGADAVRTCPPAARG